MCIEWSGEICESAQKGYQVIKDQVNGEWTDEAAAALKCEELALYPEY